MNKEPGIEVPKFHSMIVHGPGFHLRFTATHDRLRRVSAFIFKEAAEAEVEYQESLKAKNEAA